MVCCCVKPNTGILETPNSKKSKSNDYLHTRVEEAATMCHDHIVSGTKDPASLVMADRMATGSGGY